MAKTDPFSKPDTAENDPFSTPVTNYKKFQEFAGHLLIVRPTERRQVTTAVSKDGPSDVAIADVVDLDDPEGPQEHEGVWFFGQGLVPTLARSIDAKPLLGVLGKGTPKPGQSPAWKILPPDDAQTERAKKYWLSRNPFASS